MKREYTKPEVEKISFCYRDQVVAASGGTGGSASDPIVPSNPNVGDWTNNPGASGCSWHVAEEWNIGLCGIM